MSAFEDSPARNSGGLAWKLQQYVSDVFPFRDQKTVRDLCGNVDDVSSRERMPCSPFEALADELSGAAPCPGLDHPAAKLQRALAALYHDDVHDVIVLLRKPVGIPIQHPEPVAPIVGKCFARGVVGADLLRERGFPLTEFGKIPLSEARSIGGANGHEDGHGQNKGPQQM